MDLADKISEAFEGVGIPNTVEPHQYLHFMDSQETPIFSCRVKEGEPMSGIENFRTHGKYRGKKISTLALQTMARHFEERGSKFISADQVRDDGLSFWPRFGAMPHDGAPSQRSYAPPFIEERIAEVHGDFLISAFLIAGEDPEAAWYHLTDPKTNTPRELIERYTLGSYDKSMVMDLSHAPVRERLGLDKR